LAYQQILKFKTSTGYRFTKTLVQQLILHINLWLDKITGAPPNRSIIRPKQIFEKGA